MAESRQLVVTGMHRSGTSLVASAVAHAGVWIGADLLGATPSNPRGHFEDVEFLAWHEAVFADNRRNVFDAHRDGGLAISEGRRREARALIDARRQRPLWGWKDPRSCLFLDFWLEMLPEARFLFVFRRPEEVLASLDRRRHHELTRRWPGLWTLRRLGLDATFRRRRAARWWLASNVRLLDFATRHPQRCLVVELAHLRRQLPMAIDHIRERWQFPIEAVGPDELDSVFDDRLLHSAKPAAEARASGAVGRTLAGLERLAAKAWA